MTGEFEPSLILSFPWFFLKSGLIDNDPLVVFLWKGESSLGFNGPS